MLVAICTTVARAIHVDNAKALKPIRNGLVAVDLHVQRGQAPNSHS
jgi:hypothetical protein